MQNKFEAHLFGAEALPFSFHYDFLPPQHGFPCHWHPNIELLYIVTGEGVARLDEEEFSIQGGDILLIGSSVTHVLSANQELQYYCLIPDREFALANALDTDTIEACGKLHDAAAAALFDTVIAEYQATDPYRAAGIRAAVLQLLVYLARHTLGTLAPASHREKNEGIRLAIGYLRAHYAEKLTIEALAAEAGMSKYYFLRKFKEATGETPISFLNRIRCEHAKRLLVHEPLSLAEIAEKVGFSDLSYFGKIFKSYVDTTPGEYRRKMRHT